MKPANYQRVLLGAIIFAGAFLLFQIQPVISKYMLPWFGGSSAVWTIAMLFFQIGLVGGYAYAFLSNKYFSPRTQAIVHIVLLLIAVLVLPITPGEQWKPSATDDPMNHILALLAANIGLVYLLLAATSPLMQTWFRRTYPNSSPYRLYALWHYPGLVDNEIR